MIHRGLAALEKWDTIEYAAGYRARLAAIPDSEIAHHFSLLAVLDIGRCGIPTRDASLFIA
jgi:hypothetical protein